MDKIVVPEMTPEIIAYIAAELIRRAEEVKKQVQLLEEAKKVSAETMMKVVEW